MAMVPTSPSQRFYRSRAQKKLNDDDSSLSSVPDSDSESVASAKTPCRTPLLAETSSQRHSATSTTSAGLSRSNSKPDTLASSPLPLRKPRRGRPPPNRPVSTPAPRRSRGRPPIYTNLPPTVTTPQEIKRERRRQGRVVLKARREHLATLEAQVDALELMSKDLRGEVDRLRKVMLKLSDGILEPGEAGVEQVEKCLGEETRETGSDKNGDIDGHEDLNAEEESVDEDAPSAGL